MDLMTRRRALLARVESGGRLPAEYQEVEWIQNTGTQYFVVPYRMKQSTVVKAKFAYYDLSGSNNGILFGSRKSAVSMFNAVGSLPTTGVFFQWGNNTSGEYYEIGNRDTNIHVAEWDFVNRSITLDGVIYQSGKTTTFQATDVYCGVFAENRGSGVHDFKSKAKLFYLTVIESGVKVVNLIPCYRKADDKPGMYDLVSDTFFTNAGTGDFIVGADVIY